MTAGAGDGLSLGSRFLAFPPDETQVEKKFTISFEKRRRIETDSALEALFCSFLLSVFLVYFTLYRNIRRNAFSQSMDKPENSAV